MPRGYVKTARVTVIVVVEPFVWVGRCTTCSSGGLHEWCSSGHWGPEWRIQLLHVRCDWRQGPDRKGWQHALCMQLRRVRGSICGSAGAGWLVLCVHTVALSLVALDMRRVRGWHWHVRGWYIHWRNRRRHWQWRWRSHLGCGTWRIGVVCKLLLRGSKCSPEVG